MTKENIIIQMEMNMKVDGNLIINQDKVYINTINKKRCMKVNLEKERKMDKENIIFKMEIYMKVNFEMMKNLVRENKFLKMEIHLKENG